MADTQHRVEIIVFVNDKLLNKFVVPLTNPKETDIRLEQAALLARLAIKDVFINASEAALHAAALEHDQLPSTGKASENHTPAGVEGQMTVQ